METWEIVIGWYGGQLKLRSTLPYLFFVFKKMHPNFFLLKKMHLFTCSKHIALSTFIVDFS